MEVITLRNSHGDFEVHKPGCRDLRPPKFYKNEIRTSVSENVQSRYEVAESMYGRDCGDFYEGRMDSTMTYEQFIRNCTGEFIFAPCVKGLK